MWLRNGAMLYARDNEGHEKWQNAEIMASRRKFSVIDIFGLAVLRLLTVGLLSRRVQGESHEDFSKKDVTVHIESLELT
jgi:hypothetical protein